MIQMLLTAIGLAICVVLMLRLCLGARRQQRFDAAMHRAMQACRKSALWIYRWRSSRRDAANLAQDAISRARDSSERVEREGNVYRPQSFRGPRKPH